jgi:hypothetical protein
MNGARATTVDSTVTKGSWSEIFRNGLGVYSALVIGGIAMNATQMLVIAIIMPTIVRDIGGASFYTWAAMLYTIGAIVGGASTGMVWSRLGARRAYMLGAGVFALGTVCCALAGRGPHRDRGAAAFEDLGRVPNDGRGVALEQGQRREDRGIAAPAGNDHLCA